MKDRRNIKKNIHLLRLTLNFSCRNRLSISNNQCGRLNGLSDSPDGPVFGESALCCEVSRLPCVFRCTELGKRKRSW